MNQLDALFVVLGIGLLVSLIVGFLPASLSPLKSRSAMTHLGCAIGMLFLNLHPIVSSEILINRSGQEITPIALFFATLIPSSLLFYLAFRAEEKETRN